ncbi:DUF3800 domain-containing protein [Phaeobacter inhibens]|uniref:DUF3800 domain-containing protein n=1 Tax=Phaeobacter inhibens TaxID=221822 RepID=UPI0020C7CC37|nr:DUF3800 domain-containing protein [Phaeobacter inhibens]
MDEAGDEGFGKLRNSNSGGQSAWLLLGGIVVSKENDRLLPSWRDEIMDQFPKKRRRDLHFHKLKHEQKVLASRTLAEKPFGACVVASYKPTLLDLGDRKLEVFKSKGHLYNYLVRFLLERVTSACATKSHTAGRQCKVYVTFSKRGGTDYEVMRDYLFLMRDGREIVRPVRSIDWSVLHPEDVKVEDHSNRAGLQIADVATSAVYNALEPNLYGDTEPRYANNLRSRFLKINSQILNCGITLVPRACTIPEQSRLYIDGL